MKKILIAQTLIALISSPLSAQNLAGPAFQELLKFDAGQTEPAKLSPVSAAPANGKTQAKSPSSLTVVVGLGGVDASKTPVAADAVLKGLGITVARISQDTKLVITDARAEYAGQAVLPPSAADPNLLTQKGANGPISFTLKFDKPVCAFSATRPALIAGANGISHPRWTATAYAGVGAADSASEDMIRYFDSSKPLPAQAFKLSAKGPGQPLTTVNVESDGNLYVKAQDGSVKSVPFAAFNGVLLSNITIEYCPQ